MPRLLPVLLLVLAAVGGLTAAAWARVGKDRHKALEEQALAIALVLRGAAEEAASTVATAEDHLGRRLAAAARRAEAELAGVRGPAADVLQRVATDERVGRVYLLDAAGKATAAVRNPPALDAAPEGMLAREKKDAIEREEAEVAVRRLAPPPGEVRVEGLAPGVFGPRERFGVAYGRPDGGTLLLRADAQELADLRRRFGLGPTLERVSAQGSVRRASLLDAEGRVVLGGSPAGALPAATARAAEVVTRGDDAVRATVRVEDAARRPYWVDVVMGTEEADAAVARSREAILLSAGVAGLLALGLATVLLVREARHERARLLAALKAEEDRRLSEMGAIAGLVTHELSNPLNSISLGLGLIEETPPGPERDSFLATVREETARMGRTLESFLGLVRGGEQERRLVGPDTLDRVAERVAVEAQERGVRVDVAKAATAPSVRGDPAVLEQALTNLARNAIQATPQGGAVALGWTRTDDGGVAVTVRDQGPGFPKEGREELLRLGASRRPGGHGLGLPLALRFARSHGGRLALLDAPGGGALVEFRLPAADAEGVGRG